MKTENKTSQTTKPAIAVEPVLATGLYCIKVLANELCYIANWDGDPGRTLVKESAKTFKSKTLADKYFKKIKVKYPNRLFWVEPFH